MMQQHICPWWLAYTFDNPLRSLVHRPAKILSGMVAKGMRVADIGCGMGHFSLGLARMVGPEGKVYAVDVQPRMLDRVAKRARKASLSSIIETRLSSADGIAVEGDLDFILAFWMVHETPDAGKFFEQAQSLLKPGGALLVAEPKFHVQRHRFDQEMVQAREAGFQLAAQPTVTFSHAALLKL